MDGRREPCLSLPGSQQPAARTPIHRHWERAEEFSGAWLRSLTCVVPADGQLSRPWPEGSVLCQPQCGCLPSVPQALQAIAPGLTQGGPGPSVWTCRLRAPQLLRTVPHNGGLSGLHTVRQCPAGLPGTLQSLACEKSPKELAHSGVEARWLTQHLLSVCCVPLPTVCVHSVRGASPLPRPHSKPSCSARDSERERPLHTHRNGQTKPPKLTVPSVGKHTALEPPVLQGTAGRCGHAGKQRQFLRQ